MARLDVRVSDELRAAVEVRAVAERRRPADIVRLALESYLGSEVVQPGAVVRAVQEVAVASARPGSLPKRRLARTAMCEHRVPPTSFCKVCDA